MEKKPLSKKELFDQSHSVFNSSGNPIVGIYEWDKDHKKLVKTGERNIQEEVDAAAVGCGVYGIIDRILHGSALVPPGPTNGEFLDVSGMSGVSTGEAMAGANRFYAAAQAKASAAAVDKDVKEEKNKELGEIMNEIALIKKKIGGLE